MSSLRNDYNRLVKDQYQAPFIRSLTVDGDQLSDDDMNVNGSITPVEFWSNIETDSIVQIKAIQLSISDGGSPAIDDYGGINGGLDNGIQFFIDIGGPGGERIFFYPTIKTNNDIVKVATDFNIFQFASNIRVVTYEKLYFEFSDGFFLDGRNGDRMGVIIQDNCSTLVHHHVVIEGSETKASFNA